MSKYLLGKEQTELLKSEKRRLIMPDGTARTVEMFNLFWRWYDRIITYDYGLTETELVEGAFRLLEREPQLSFDEALAFDIETTVYEWEKSGMDVTETDADLWIAAARGATMRFHARKAERKNKSQDGSG